MVCLFKRTRREVKYGKGVTNLWWIKSLEGEQVGNIDIKFNTYRAAILTGGEKMLQGIVDELDFVRGESWKYIIVGKSKVMELERTRE